MSEPAENPRAIPGANSLMAFYRDQNAALPDYLMADNEALLARVATLETDYLNSPNTVDTDDREREMTDLGGRLAKLLKDVAAQKKATKEPVAAGTKIIDDFFTRLTAPCEAAKGAIERRINAYKDEKRAQAERARQEAERVARAAADEARRAQEEARRKADEEERLRQESASSADQGAAYAERAEAEQEAHRAAVAAREAQTAVTIAKAPAQTTARGETGTKSIQSVTWHGEIDDLATLDLNELRTFIPRAALDSAVRAYAVQYKDTRPLAGARCFSKTSTSFR